MLEYREKQVTSNKAPKSDGFATAWLGRYEKRKDGHTLCSNLPRSNLSSLHSSGRPTEHNFEHMPSFVDEMWFSKYLK